MVVFPDRATDVAAIVPFQGLVQGGLLRRVYLEDLLNEALDDRNDPSLARRLARLVVLDRERTPLAARMLVESTAALPMAERYRIIDLIETIACKPCLPSVWRNSGRCR